jgi:hypothetical protein
LAIPRRQVADGRFDFLQRAHGARLRRHESPRKRSTRNVAADPVRHQVPRSAGAFGLSQCK